MNFGKLAAPGKDYAAPKMGAFVGSFELCAFVARREAGLKKAISISHADAGFINEMFYFA